MGAEERRHCKHTNGERNQNQYSRSVGDIRRDMEGHHYAEKSSVFGINAQELAALQKNGLVTRPREFNPSLDRFQVLASPWSVMRFLGSEFGYLVACMPTLGQVQSAAGERKTCIYTMRRYTAVEDSNAVTQADKQVAVKCFIGK
eukprot:TRINITY_DN16186_c0_g1_i1.p1 TRINITY_DN16186_c0_g1~~TRINITY_DN16186_c0_g1_i1.p1  ORF type:complete len:145 (-),score=13.19 TRINITY_DN16186_c0_g1_i1:30-464(-)